MYFKVSKRQKGDLNTRPISQIFLTFTKTKRMLSGWKYSFNTALGFSNLSQVIPRADCSIQTLHFSTSKNVHNAKGNILWTKLKITSIRRCYVITVIVSRLSEQPLYITSLWCILLAQFLVTCIDLGTHLVCIFLTCSLCRLVDRLLSCVSQDTVPKLLQCIICQHNYW